MRLLSFVNAADLTSWAMLLDAQATLPQLVRRLVHATVSRVRRAEFRAGEGVQQGGWDGIVEVERGNAFVPDGRSAWELGTGKNVKPKADSDYEKRCKDPLGIDPPESTFVFVTPRRWAGKDEWANGRRRENKWRDVRAYDADSLEEWLELAPAVHLWLSIHLGKHSEGAEDIDSFWETWSGVTQPPMSPELVLAGRQTALQAIHEWLNSPSTPLVIRAESPAEAIAVFAAAVHALPPRVRVEVASRLLIVHDIASWNSLTAQNERLILVRDFESAEAYARAEKRGHATVVALGHADSVSSGSIEVPRIARGEAAKALCAMGVPEAKARELVTSAGRNLTALRRKISAIPKIERPEWARAENPASLIPALLAGRWSDQTDGDLEVIAKLAGAGYSEVSSEFVRWSRANDPPVRCVGEAWYLSSPEDAWILLGRFVTRDHLERFREVVLDALGPPDSSFELPEADRWMAGIRGHVSRHSGLLKEGLANTLAIMGARAESLETTGDIPLSVCADSCVRKLLDTQDWKVWASLPLPLLAEAAPDEFLAAVDRGLVGDEPTLAGLFRDKAEGTFSSPSHTDLLWALKCLAWSADYLVRVTSSLGKLARLDPGGNWSDRPSESLRTIFLPWLPGTSASLDRRLDAIDSIRKSLPEVAWTLMHALLPRNADHQCPSARPRWRDWAPEADVRVTRREHGRAVQELVTRMIDDAGTNGRRWGDFLEAVTKLPRAEYDAVVARLEALDPGTMQPDDSSLLWNALRSLVSQHRSHREAQWSLPLAEVDRFAALLPRFEPDDPLPRFGWLFGDHIALPEGRGDDLEEHECAIASQQCRAVEVLHGQSGINWLPEFVESVEHPAGIGAAIARSAIGKRVEDDLLHEYIGPEDPKSHRFVGGFIGEQVRSAGLEWAQQKLTTLGQNWSAAQRASFCVCLPFESTTWNIVQGQDKETVREYWDTVSPWYVNGADVKRATRELLAHDRPHVAIVLLQLHVDDKSLPPTLVLDALEKLVRSSPSEKDQRRVSAHDLSDLLAFVSGADDVDEGRVAALEWALLPALGRHHYIPKLLHRELARSPKFFAEVVSLVYRSEDEESVEPSEAERSRWRCAYELLQSWRWRPLPGMPENGDIEPEAIRKWVVEARDILRADGRLSGGDKVIGQVLSGSPAGDDGVWPHPYLRDLIEEIGSDDFDHGISMGLLKSQGVTSRSLDEGGTREHKEADQYDGWANSVSRRWGRTAAMLRGLAEHYRSRAKEEDQRAELREDLPG